MGQAKLRRRQQVPTVYHHTSTLRTNLIWMSGVIQVEGQHEPALHPQLGIVETDATLRRPLKDFPAVAWFTSNINIPNVLTAFDMVLVDKSTGEERGSLSVSREISNAYALNRVALGFPLANIPVVPWPNYYGYSTREGRELNESARDRGDNPDEWYISEMPVDVLQISEFWASSSIMKPKLRRSETYINDIRRMVTLCREQGVFIPPSWLKEQEAVALARRVGVPIQ